MNTTNADAFDTDEDRFGPQEDQHTVAAEDARGYVVILPDGSRLDVYTVRHAHAGADAPTCRVTLYGTVISDPADAFTWHARAHEATVGEFLPFDTTWPCLP